MARTQVSDIFNPQRARSRGQGKRLVVAELRNLDADRREVSPDLIFNAAFRRPHKYLGSGEWVDEVVGTMPLEQRDGCVTVSI